MSRAACLVVVLTVVLVRDAVAQAPVWPPDGAGFQLNVDSARREVVITLGPYHVASDSGMEEMTMADMPMADVLSPPFAWPISTWVRGYHLPWRTPPGTRCPAGCCTTTEYSTSTGARWRIP